MALINSLKLNKAKSHDDIDPYFLKIAAPILAFPLSVFLNHCLTFGTFPNRLKLAKVVPVFKKGPTDQSVIIDQFRFYLLCLNFLNV